LRSAESAEYEAAVAAVMLHTSHRDESELNELAFFSANERMERERSTNRRINRDINRNITKSKKYKRIQKITSTEKINVIILK
jgi:hypothetical protein